MERNAPHLKSTHQRLQDASLLENLLVVENTEVEGHDKAGHPGRDHQGQPIHEPGEKRRSKRSIDA